MASHSQYPSSSNNKFYRSWTNKAFIVSTSFSVCEYLTSSIKKLRLHHFFSVSLSLAFFQQFRLRIKRSSGITYCSANTLYLSLNQARGSLDSIFTKHFHVPLFGAYRKMFDLFKANARKRRGERRESERSAAIPENKSPLIS